MKIRMQKLQEEFGLAVVLAMALVAAYFYTLGVFAPQSPVAGDNAIRVCSYDAPLGGVLRYTDGRGVGSSFILTQEEEKKVRCSEWREDLIPKKDGETRSLLITKSDIRGNSKVQGGVYEKDFPWLMGDYVPWIERNITKSRRKIEIQKLYGFKYRLSVNEQ